jgi:MoxR-like ATPase
MKLETQVIKARLNALKESISNVIVGLEPMIEMMQVAMLSGGHILLEGPPGLGKTTLAKTFAQSIGGSFHRIQMTPDLLPSDILGVNVYNPLNAIWNLRKGPIFSNIILIDELNRAAPKVQSAFLQVMQEQQVTIENETLEVSPPFMVIGTQLPLGELGTYPLTNVQIDRFAFRVELGNPGADDEVRILERSDQIQAGGVEQVVSSEEIMELMDQVRIVHVEESILRYIVDLVQGLRDNEYIRMGPSPRASIWLYRGSRAKALLDGRDYVIPDDVKRLVRYTVPHRIELTQESRYQQVSLMGIVNETLETTVVPKGLE